jgi:tetratricopeptide (TPR) repeat protein
VAVVFALARKWSDRYDTAKAQEKYKEVIALDPEGKAGTYTDSEDSQITASYTDFAKFEVAAASFMGRNPDPAPLKAFIAENPKSPLVRQAYRQLGYFYARAPKADADAFFADYAARYPDDPQPLVAWLGRIIRDKGPVDKGLELAGRLRELTAFDPSLSISQSIAQMYDLAGDKAKVEKVYGKEFADNEVRRLAYGLIAYANYWADKKENRESALEMAETALKLQPDSIPMLRTVAGVYARFGDEAKALELYGPAWLEKKIAGKADQDINSYASFWARQGTNLESALAAAKASCEMQPKAYFYWSTLSDVYAKMDDKTQAVKALETAIALAPATAKAAMQRKLEALKTPEAVKK